MLVIGFPGVYVFRTAPLEENFRFFLPNLSNRLICNGVAVALPSTCRLVRQNEGRNFDCLHIFVCNRKDSPSAERLNPLIT